MTYAPLVHVELVLRPLDPTFSGFRLPSGTKSLLYKLNAGTPDEVVAGAVTDTRGRLIKPGGTFRAWLHFWSPEIQGRLHPHQELEVWYGRTVGSARVLQVTDLPDE